MRFFCCLKKKSGKKSGKVAPGGIDKGAELALKIGGAGSLIGGAAGGAGAAEIRYVLSEEQATARTELTRVLEAINYGYVELAEDRDKKSLTITGAVLEKYEPMLRAAVGYFAANFSGQKIIIRAFQSPSFSIEGRALGDCVSLSFYQEKRGKEHSINRIIFKYDNGEIRVITAEDYELLCTDESSTMSPKADDTGAGIGMNLTAGAGGAGAGDLARPVVRVDNLSPTAARPPRPESRAGSTGRTPLAGKGMGFLRHTGASGSAMRPAGAGRGGSGDHTSPMARVAASPSNGSMAEG